MPLNTHRICAICFDIDGTLSDTDDQFVLKLSRWLQPAHWLFPQWEPRGLARRIVMATETPATFLYGLPDRLGFDDEIAAVADFIYLLGLGKTPTPFMLIAGVREMLLKLSQRYPLAIVSARGERSALRFLNQFNLAPFFQCIATAQTCHHTKPFSDPLLWVARQIGIPVQQLLMVGDTVVDIRAGRAAGAQTVGVLCGFGTEAELRDAGADLILQVTSLLVGVLRNESQQP